MDVQWEVDKLSLIGLPPDVCEARCESDLGPWQRYFLGRNFCYMPKKEGWKLWMTISDSKFDKIWDTVW